MTIDTGTHWTDDQGRACWVESVRGEWCRIARRLAPRRIVRQVLPVAAVREQIARAEG